MPTFDVIPGQRLRFEIEGQAVELIACTHPSAPRMAHVLEGGKAQVFRVTDTAKHADYALKVMKPRHRVADLVEVCERLGGLHALPGLAACERICLTQNTAHAAIQQYPDLEYAVLMPWMQGRTWFDKVWSRNALTRDESLRLALHCASVLVGLEGLRLAHCDISGANVIFDPVTFAIALIDVEDMYGEYRPGEPFTQPASVPLGTPGYQHRTSARGQWGAEADRFAGAVLLAEMLGWYDDRVRTEASGESYFEPTELQQPGCPRFGVLREALAALGGPLAALLDRAWRSSALAECPSLAEWRYHIESVSPHAAAAPSSGPVTGWRLPPPVQGVEPEPVTWNRKLRMDGPAASPTPVVFKSLPPSLAVAPPVTGWARPSVDQGIVARQPTFWGTRKPRAEKT